MKNYSKFSPLVLRIGIAVVLLWFGFSQLKNPAQWTRMMPDYVNIIFPFSKAILIYMNGIVEIILGAILLLGLWTRVTSALITLHLLHITTIVGYGAVGARDLALALAALAIFLHGPDEYCLDNYIKKEKYIPPHQR